MEWKNATRRRRLAGAGIQLLMIVATAFLETAGAADPSPPLLRDITPLLAPIIAQHDVPGMAAAIVTVDGLKAHGAVGVRQRGEDAAITIDDRFHIGSCTKAMTATLCAMLVEEGRLRWDLTLAEAFPELAAEMNVDLRAVTLELLLQHRGGIAGDLTPDGLWQRLWDYRGEPSEGRAMLVREVLQHPPIGPVGRYQYANAGYAIAGHIAERAAGQQWEQLIRARLFDPLQMTSAGFGPPGSAKSLDQPRGHGADGRPVPPGREADNPALMGPAGNVHATVDDWAKFIALHLRGAAGDTELLKAASFARLHQARGGREEPGDSAYAMGWGVTTRPWAGGVALNHSGSNTMWFATTWLSPSRGFAVLVACNQGGDAGAKACDQATTALIQDHLSNVAPIAPPVPTGTQRDPAG